MIHKEKNNKYIATSILRKTIKQCMSVFMVLSLFYVGLISGLYITSNSIDLTKLDYMNNFFNELLLILAISTVLICLLYKIIHNTFSYNQCKEYENNENPFINQNAQKDNKVNFKRIKKRVLQFIINKINELLVPFLFIVKTFVSIHILILYINKSLVSLEANTIAWLFSSYCFILIELLIFFIVFYNIYKKIQNKLDVLIFFIGFVFYSTIYTIINNYYNIEMYSYISWLLVLICIVVMSLMMLEKNSFSIKDTINKLAHIDNTALINYDDKGNKNEITFGFMITLDLSKLSEYDEIAFIELFSNKVQRRISVKLKEYEGYDPKNAHYSLDEGRYLLIVTNSVNNNILHHNVNIGMERAISKIVVQSSYYSNEKIDNE